MRIQTKDLFETWDRHEDKLKKEFGNIDLFVPGPGLQRAIYNVDTGKDLIRGTNKVIWKWILKIK